METVLIVDDEPDLRYLLREYLKNEGYDCLEASNGQSAFQVMNDHGAIDLILTDFHMPGMNGLELLRSMKWHPIHCHIPAILITAERSIDICTQAVQAGARNVLFKPYDIIDLMCCVNGLLRPCQVA